MRLQYAMLCEVARKRSAAQPPCLEDLCHGYSLREECRTQVMEEYMACLKQHGSVAEQCRPLAKRYFECRMERCAAAAACVKAMAVPPKRGWSYH